MADKTECEELGLLCNGCHLYRKPNGAGGHMYFSDEVGGGVCVWDTVLVAEETLLAAICCEHNRKYAEYVKKVKPHIDLPSKLKMEKCAATGTSFVPKEVASIPSEDEDSNEYISDWLKMRAITCYLALQGKDRTHNVTEVTPAQFDKCNAGWKRDWIRVARVSS